MYSAIPNNRVPWNKCIGMYVFEIKIIVYTLKHANLDSTKNVLLLKNLQFLPNHNETLLKGGVHVYLIFTKFHNNWIKIVDFLIKGHFC